MIRKKKRGVCDHGARVSVVSVLIRITIALSVQTEIHFFRVVRITARWDEDVNITWIKDVAVNAHGVRYGVTGSFPSSREKGADLGLGQRGGVGGGRCGGESGWL